MNVTVTFPNGAQVVYDIQNDDDIDTLKGYISVGPPSPLHGTSVDNITIRNAGGNVLAGGTVLVNGAHYSAQ